MLTTRTLLLLVSGLLTGYLAAGQSTTPAPTAGPTPTDILGWLVWALAALVLLMALITGATVASASQRRREAAPAPTTSTEQGVPA